MINNILSSEQHDLHDLYPIIEDISLLDNNDEYQQIIFH
jgi:hypothetical protein